MLLWRPIWPKRTQKCVYSDEMFLFTILLEHPSHIKRVLHINLVTSDVPMQHFCITAPKYGGLYRTFYDVRNTQFLSIFLVVRVQKWKMTDRLWCKLSALSKHGKPYDKLWISLSEAPISIEPTARPLFFMQFNLIWIKFIYYWEITLPFNWVANVKEAYTCFIYLLIARPQRYVNTHVYLPS